jgi:hypothetical protein
VELGDRKLIVLRNTKQSRLPAIGDRLSTLYQNMRGLTESFERHWYGFAEAAPGDWQDFKAGYLAAIRTSD